MRDLKLKKTAIGLLLGLSMYLPVLAAAAVQFGPSWGAVATSSSKLDAIGVAFDQATKSEAKQKAIDACEKVHKTQCKVAVSFYNQCIGIAQAYSNHQKFYFSTKKYDKTQLKPLRKLVSAQAIARCENKTGKQCKEVNAFCTGYVAQ